MASRDKYGRSYGIGRTRNYATVVYQESAPEDWQSVLRELCISAFVSPYHDMDKNPDGEPKKPHWHVMIMFDTVKTKEQAKEIFDQIGGVGCEVISSLRGYARYLCHLDNPDKHQYNKEDVICFAGTDYLRTIGLPSDRYIALDEMVDFCDANNIYYFSELVRYARAYRPNDWLRVLQDNGTYFIRSFLMSKQDERFAPHISNNINMLVDYSPLYGLLASKGMSKSDLTDCISSATVARISRGYAVDIRTINKICAFLECQPGDVMAFVKEEEPANVPESADEPAVQPEPKDPDPDMEPVSDDEPVLPPAPLPRAPQEDAAGTVHTGNRYARRHHRRKPKSQGGGNRP